MQTSATISLASAPTAAPADATARDANLRHLPAPARAAFEQFQAGGDPAALDPVVIALLEDFSPRRDTLPLAGRPGHTRLIEDLGFDSLAITEVVFAAEDLFHIRITNEEIVQVRTLDDLRGFIHAKVADRPMR